MDWSDIPDGDVLTIEGLRINRKGKHIFNCREGRESEWIVFTDEDGLKKMMPLKDYKVENIS